MRIVSYFSVNNIKKPNFMSQNAYGASTSVQDVDPDHIYRINDGLFSGQEIINQINNPHIVAILGAAGLGFVVGWLLAFVNKFVDKTKINSTYFVSIFTTIFGGVVIGFYNSSEVLLGTYGVGFFVGFIFYSLIYARIDTKKGEKLKKLVYPYYEI